MDSEVLQILLYNVKILEFSGAWPGEELKQKFPID